jgi:diguanylate cyclase (GGDEF)-like protein
MKPPGEPEDEAERLAALEGLNLLDTPAEERFDRITRLARKVLDVPMALVSLVDADRQWFKSAQGLNVAETPREVSFCGHAVLQDRLFVVGDAAGDDRFADNPLVTGDPRIRFYAGYPLRAPSGHRVGTLCVIDRRPRDLGEEERRTLEDLGSLAEGELQRTALSQQQLDLLRKLSAAERRASIDPLTRVWSREPILSLLERERALAVRGGRPLSIALADVDHFKQVNDHHGHLAGDEVLKGAAERMRRALRPYDAIGRYGGDEFLVVLPGTTEPGAQATAERICRVVAESPIGTPGGPFTVTTSIGVCAWDDVGRGSVTDMLELADRALYEAKAGGRNRARSSRQPPSSPAGS